MSVYSRAQSRYTLPCSVTKRAKCIDLLPSSLAGTCWDGKLSWMLRRWFLKGDMKIGLSLAEGILSWVRLSRNIHLSWLTAQNHSPLREHAINTKAI